MADDQLSASFGAITIDALCRAFVQCVAGERAAEPTAAQRAFLTSVVEDYRPDELVGVTASDLAAVLAGFWAYGADPGAAVPAARLIGAVGADGRALGRDLLEIVQPDVPFLVDSVMGAIVDRGGEIHAMFHPVVATHEGRRSMIQAWLSPVPEERRTGLVAPVLDTLAAVQFAGEDFPA